MNTAGKKSVLTVGRVPKIETIARFFKVSVKQGLENLNLIFPSLNSAQIPLPCPSNPNSIVQWRIGIPISHFSPQAPLRTDLDWRCGNLETSFPNMKR